MNIITPITSSTALAFLPRYRWTPQETRARRLARVALAKLTAEVGQRYAREQMHQDLSDAINRHWRQG